MAKYIQCPSPNVLHLESLPLNLNPLYQVHFLLNLFHFQLQGQGFRFVLADTRVPVMDRLCIHKYI